MKKYNLLAPKGYPMYQQIKMKSNGIEGQYEVGSGVLDLVSIDRVQVGDLLGFEPYSLTVTDINEERVPKGNHKDAAIFQKVAFKYIKPLAQ